MKCRCDLWLLCAVLALTGTGFLFVYSASMYTALSYGSQYYFLFKQLLGGAAGFAAMAFFRFVKIDLLKKFYIAAVVVSALLLGCVFIPGLGIENYGAKRWIGFGGFSFQPSEIAKFSFVLFCAAYASRRDMKKFPNVLPVAAVGGAFCLLIILEPNMSITMCMTALMAVMLFLSGVRIKHFLLLLCPLVAAVPLLIVAEPYRLQRLLAFLDPWASPKDEGYQLIQSLYALGRGGFFGVGLFNGRQKYLFLPFAESDFILSVIGEETGLIGCLAVFLLYFVVIFRGIRIAANCRDKFRCYLAAGITAVIAVQSLLNFAVVTGSIPPTGLPLPFISYGGTSLVVFLSAAGILLNLSAEIKSREGVVWIT